MTQLPQSLTITQPDDWHLHLRDGAALAAVLPYSVAQFGRAIVMPNLKPPVTTTALALAYRDRILAALPEGSRFQPLMTLYLTDHTKPDEVLRAREAGVVAFKLYPAGATTNSADGVTNIRKIYPVLELMQEVGLVLCVHGEVTDPSVDIFDREAVFIDRVLTPLRRDLPGIRVVMEHITTKDAVDYVWDGGRGIAATITPHHLLYNRNALFLSQSGATGFYPDNYCLPVLKREEHRLALVAAATSGNPKFFLGTDSAPHAAVLKDAMPSCAGCFTAPTALELYVMAFEQAGELGMLDDFASRFGADFYGLPRNTDLVLLERHDQVVPQTLPFGETIIKPFMGGMIIPWRYAQN